MWALVVLVFPSIPDYAGRLIKVPSPLEFFYSEIDVHIKMSDKIKEINEKFKRNGIAEGSNEVKIEIEKARNQFYAQSNNFNQRMENGTLTRLGLSMGISLLCPYACYTLAANEVAATGVSVNALLMKQKDEYWKRLSDYLKQIAPICPAPNNS